MAETSVKYTLHLEGGMKSLALDQALLYDDDGMMMRWMRGDSREGWHETASVLALVLHQRQLVSWAHVLRPLKEVPLSATKLKPASLMGARASLEVVVAFRERAFTTPFEFCRANNALACQSAHSLPLSAICRVSRR